MRARCFKIRKRQRGLSLMLVMVLLVVTVSTSLHFHQRLVASTLMSGATRDNSESLMLAESAMEMLRGGFINTLCSIDDCSVLGPDSQRTGSAVSKKMDSVDALNTGLAGSGVPYVYYVGAATQQSPSILQSVANDGAGVTGTACTIASASRAISAVGCNLDIDTLFGGAGTDFRPLLYTTQSIPGTTQSNGLLVASNAANWQAVLDSDTYNDTVAAAWIELTVNADPENPDAVDLWVQASAQVGPARSYVQRYLGTYHPVKNVLGNLSGMVEASNIDRSKNP